MNRGRSGCRGWIANCCATMKGKVVFTLFVLKAFANKDFIISARTLVVRVAYPGWIAHYHHDVVIGVSDFATSYAIGSFARVGFKSGNNRL